MTLVSIITPSYNQAAFLEQTIRSVLLQEGVEIEYCVVDGASTDSSIEIIQRYAAQNVERSSLAVGYQGNVRRLSWWVSEPDRGQAEAINKGFRRTHGDILAWLNSDDLYLPGAVQKAVTVLQANPELGLVYGDAITIDESGHPLNRLSFGDWNLSDLLAFRILCQPAVFMRRSILEQAGYLDLSYHYMLDHHLWIRMGRLAPIEHIQEILAVARQHAGAKNVKQAAGFSIETQRCLEWIQTQPDLAEILQNERRRILGGAYRLEARYYLDGGEPRTALNYYAKSLWYSPRYAWKHWHRMVYAIFSILGGKKLADRFLLPASAQRKQQTVPAELKKLGDWPGLNLEGLA